MASYVESALTNGEQVDYQGQGQHLVACAVVTSWAHIPGLLWVGADSRPRREGAGVAGSGQNLIAINDILVMHKSDWVSVING